MKKKTNPSPLFLMEAINTQCAEIVAQNKNFHQHTYYSIYWIQKGSVVHATDFVEHTVHASSILFVPSGLKHRMLIDDSCHGISLFFDASILSLPGYTEILRSSLFTNPDFYSIIELSDKDVSEFDFYIRQLQAEKTKPDELSKNLISSLLFAFLAHSLRLHQFQYQHDSGISEENPKGVLTAFRSLIEQSFVETKDVSWYAEQLNMRPACLNDISKKVAGFTAGEMIRNRVLQEAKKMLYATNKTSKEIAYDLGFNDPAYFSRFFKKYTQTTLSSFRSQSRLSSFR